MVGTAPGSAGPRFPAHPGLSWRIPLPASTSPRFGAPAGTGGAARRRRLTSRVMVFPVRVFTKICMTRRAAAARGRAGRRGRSADCPRCSQNGGGGPRERRARTHGVSVRGAGGRAARRDYDSRHAPPGAAASVPAGMCSPAAGDVGGNYGSHSASRWPSYGEEEPP